MIMDISSKKSKLIGFIFLPFIVFAIIICILFSGAMGGGTSMPIPAEKELATEYQLIGYELNVNWVWIMLIDMYQNELVEEIDLNKANPVKTALECITIEIEIYNQTVDEEGNESWEYSYSEHANGAAEILQYFGLPQDCRDIQLVARTIRLKNSDKYKVTMQTVGSLEEVLETRYQFSEKMKAEILELYNSNYLSDLYGNSFDIGGIHDIELGDLIYSEIGMQIPLFYQYQVPWNNMAFGGGTVTTSGCSVTSLAMVFSYLTENVVTPPDIIAWTGNRYYVGNAGQSWTIFSDTARQWGVTCNCLGTNIQSVLIELSAGKPVIASMRPGTFTQRGHFIVLRGVDQNGNILVNDPNDSNIKNFFNRSFSPALIQREGKQFWSFGKE